MKSIPTPIRDCFLIEPAVFSDERGSFFESYSKERFERAIGRQVDFVLGEWTKEETSLLIERLPTSAKAITSFGTAGLANTMNTFNGK